MVLQIGCRVGMVYAALGHSLNNLCFGFSPGHKDNFLCAHHCVDANGDGVLRGDRYVSVKIAGLAFAALVCQTYAASCAGALRYGLVEAHLAQFADAHDQKVKASDHLLIFFTEFCKFLLGEFGVGDVDVVHVCIDLVQKFYEKVSVSAVNPGFGNNRIVFVDRENLYILERNLALCVEAPQPPV